MTDARSKMLAGELYPGNDPELVVARRRAQSVLARFNATAGDDPEAGAALLGGLFGAAGDGLSIQPRFSCDYGFNIRFGRDVFVNYDCVFLDCAVIEIGDGVLFGPAVQLYTAFHPFDRAVRRSGLERALPIGIGDDVWIGGGAIVLAGVTIGNGSVVGAGSIVTRDVPPGVVVAGNPARIVRRLPG